MKIYALHGFVVRLVLMDMEFEKIKDEVGLVEINTTAAREHVGEIERHIRSVKERCRCVYADMPVTHLHKQIVIHMVYFGQTMMNAFPAAKGISDRFSPREIVLGRPFDAERDLKARFGDYVEASVDADVTNDIKDALIPA